MTHFLLVHGAWGGGWAWDEVVSRLERDGHRATTVQLVSAGADPAALGDLQADAEVVRAAIRDAGEPVVLVGHSYGGMVITELADDPGVAHTVYLTAFWPQRGQAVQSFLSEGPMPAWIVPRPDGNFEVSDDVDAVREGLCADLTREQAQELRDRLVLQSGTAFTATSTAPDRTHPVTYVICEQDRAIPAELQEAFAQQADHVVRLPSAHVPQWSMPDRVVEVLESLSQEAARAPAPAG
ncbi:alpha/beta fold hydrolase [Geodermatophilus sp. URMC 64]